METYLLLFLLPLQAIAQWNNGGDNYTTGNVTASSLTTTANYGVDLAPSNGDAMIRRSNPGSLMISSKGGDSEIRLNYSYGGGSGGISVYDGGTSERHFIILIMITAVQITAPIRKRFPGTRTSIVAC